MAADWTQSKVGPLFLPVINSNEWHKSLVYSHECWLLSANCWWISFGMQNRRIVSTSRHVTSCLRHCAGEQILKESIRQRSHNSLISRLHCKLPYGTISGCAVASREHSGEIASSHCNQPPPWIVIMCLGRAGSLHNTGLCCPLEARQGKARKQKEKTRRSVFASHFGHPHRPQTGGSIGTAHVVLRWKKDQLKHVV